MAILKIIGILLEVVLLFNLLIVVHELGHFFAAKWRGLVIEGFGIWFGKPLWQKKINGVNYNLNRNKWAAVCLAKIACTQEPLLDALTNLKAGLVLYKIAGFSPWTVPKGGW